MKTQILSISALVSVLILSGCTVTLVKPYDAELYRHTEAFYKNAETLLLQGERASPERKSGLATLTVQDAHQHPGHFSRYQAEYDELLVESNTLILRSLANAGTLSEPGKRLHSNVERLLEDTLGTPCDALQRSLPDADLTTRNYVDLKCLVSKWQREHHQADHQILSKARWQNRRNMLFDSILAIQSTSSSYPSSRRTP